tara:strand:- start:1324 stop:3156 length:1833 start_codon:yes stop_codon:yes gene_type:complete
MSSSINKLKFIIKLLADAVIIYLSLYLAIIISAERILPLSKSYLFLGFIITSIQITILYLFNTYSEFTKFFDYETILKILISLFLTSLFLIILSFFAIDNSKIFFRFLNIKILTLYSATFVFFNISLKIFVKYFLFRNKNKKISHKMKNYVIYGAGQTGMELKKILQNYTNIEVLYFVDDDKNKIGRTVDGIKVLSPKSLGAKKQKIDLVLICMPSASSFEIKNIEKNIFNSSLNYKNISSLEDYLGNDERNKKQINFDHNTVLSQNFSEDLIKKFLNKKVLVTGAGGTIGKELMFQISRLNVKELIAIDFNELNLSKLKKDFDVISNDNKLIKHFYLINLCRNDLLKKIIEKHNPDLIFHAAAYKHVDIVETNPIEAVSNNLISLMNILECTKKLKDLTFIFVSTDKAVKPINHMGRSKRMGELIVCSMNKIYPQNNYSCVRFGNVIGSSGSLIPILNEQISKGGPITITDKNATRYFMTVQDAVNLTIETSNMENRGLINVLNMGEPINIFSMVMKILDDSNIQVYNENKKEGIKVDFIGLRPGEKLHEELFHSNEILKSTNEKIFKENCSVDISINQLEDIKRQIKLSNVENDENILQKMFSQYIQY